MLCKSAYAWYELTVTIVTADDPLIALSDFAESDKAINGSSAVTSQSSVLRLLLFIVGVTVT